MLRFAYVNAIYVLGPLTFFAAMIWGGRIERCVAVFYLVAWMASMASHTPGIEYLHFEEATLLVDAVLLLALLIVTVRAGYWWLIWSTSLHAIAVLGHLAKLVNPGISRLAYSLMAGISLYPTILLLALGVWLHHRRRTAAGAASSSAGS